MSSNTSLITRPNWDYADPQRAKLYDAYTKWINTPSVPGLIPTDSGSGYDFYGATKNAGTKVGYVPKYDVSDVFSQQPGMFDKLKGWWGKTKNKIFAPGTGAQASGAGASLTSPQFGWNSSSGVTGWGKNLGKGFNIANALYQGYNAARGLKDLSNAKDDTSDLMSDIVTASYNNPMLQYDLNADQMKLLRQLRSGRYESDSDINDIDLLGTLGDTAMGGLTGFLTGGIPGAVIGGVGGGANSIIGDLSNAQGATNEELDALYQAIMESEQQYNNIKKQRAYAQLMSY